MGDAEGTGTVYGIKKGKPFPFFCKTGTSGLLILIVLSTIFADQDDFCPDHTLIFFL
jgi:hypothetical protein